MSTTTHTKAEALLPRLVELLQDPTEEWLFNGITATHKRSGVSVWLANIPVVDTDTYPVSMHLSLADKWKLWKASKVARQNYLLRKLNTL